MSKTTRVRRSRLLWLGGCLWVLLLSSSIGSCFWFGFSLLGPTNDDTVFLELERAGAGITRKPQEVIFQNTNADYGIPENKGPISAVAFVKKKPVTNGDIALIASLRKCDYIGFTRCSFEDLSQLSLLKQMPNLKNLTLDGCNLRDVDLSFLLSLRKIRQLSLQDNHLTDEVIETLSQLTWLKTINLKGTKLSPEGKATLRQSLSSTQFVE